MTKYDDIIGLDRHVSVRHPHMPVSDRAAQFAPFSALTGYGDIIDETGRFTLDRSEADEAHLAQLDEALQYITTCGEGRAEIVYFVPDDRKRGGKYATSVGTIVKVDHAKKQIVMQDGTAIDMDAVVELLPR